MIRLAIRGCLCITLFGLNNVMHPGSFPRQSQNVCEKYHPLTFLHPKILHVNLRTVSENLVVCREDFDEHLGLAFGQRLHDESHVLREEEKGPALSGRACVC